MASLVLGVLGKKRSGKDTLAQRLVSEHGFTRLAFADALKDLAYDLDPIVDTRVFQIESAEQCEPIGYHVDEIRLSEIIRSEGWEAAKERSEVRRLLQNLGVAARDHIASSVWLDIIAGKAAGIDGPVVISDVRFPNEADFVEAIGGRLVRVVRPGLSSSDTHISETALDDRDTEFVVDNQGSLLEFNEMVDVLASLLTAEPLEA